MRPGTSLNAFGECVPASIDAGLQDSDDDAQTGPDAGSGESGVADGGLDIDTACLVTDNIFVIAGDGYIHGGPPLTIEGGTGWVAQVLEQQNGLPSYVAIRIGLNWETDFSTTSQGHALVPGLYANAQRAGFTDPNHPGLDVSGNGNGCNTVSGQFRVIEMTTATDDSGVATLQSFTASFEQHCEGSPQLNMGCIHIAR